MKKPKISHATPKPKIRAKVEVHIKADLEDLPFEMFKFVVTNYRSLDVASPLATALINHRGGERAAEILVTALSIVACSSEHYKKYCLLELASNFEEVKAVTH